MKKLLILTASLILLCGYANAKNTPRTADEYKAILEENFSAIYGWSWYSDASVQTVVDRSGKVLSMEFVSPNHNGRALLRPEGNTMVLTIEENDEEEGGSNSSGKYIFDDLMRMKHCEVRVPSSAWEQQALYYILDISYEKDDTESKAMHYLFPEGVNMGYGMVNLNAFPNCIPFDFGPGEGIQVEYAPELNYTSLRSTTLLGSDGKPKQNLSGYSSVRITYLPWPDDESNLYWYADEVIDELHATAPERTSSNKEGESFYISKIELLDSKGNLTNTSYGAAQATIEQGTNTDGEQTMTLRYLDREGRPANYRMDSCDFSRIEYTQSDSVRTATLYAADGTLANSPAGVARYYTKESETEEITYWADKDGKYVPVRNKISDECWDENEGNPYGFCSKRYYNNEKGQRVYHISYRGTSESDRVNCDEGYSDRITCSNPDDDDLTYSESYFGTDGNLVMNPSLGYAVKRCAYNNDNAQTELAYFDASNHPVEVNGIAREVYGYRSRYNTYSPDFTWYYNASGEMITPDNMPINTDEEDSDEYPVAVDIE